MYNMCMYDGTTCVIACTTCACTMGDVSVNLHVDFELFSALTHGTNTVQLIAIEG